MAMKLLECDGEVEELTRRKCPSVLPLAKKLRQELEGSKKEVCSMAITSEKYLISKRIIDETQRIKAPEKPSLESRLDGVLLHRIWGYAFLIAVGVLAFGLVFSFGGLFSSVLSNVLGALKAPVTEALGGGLLADVVWNGIFEGVIAGLTIVLPYILPFYVLLSILESSGYLARMAFLMDNVMHRIGLHGKAFIPLILGYGCSVPACLSCRVMEDERERITAGFVVTLIPCSARTVVILGLVGTFLGLKWALAIYVFNLIVVFLLGRVAFKVLPGEPMGLIMEMPPYRVPHLDSIAKESWGRISDFVLMAFPIIIISTFAIELLYLAGLVQGISNLLSPITVGWLGLPAVIGITLIFGILRKELTLIMLAAIFGTQNFATVLTPIQMVVFTLVTIFYIPCAATMAALTKEFGWRKALYITMFEIAFALLLGGVAFRLLSIFGVH
jgi:ferrous iron transport protein B